MTGPSILVNLSAVEFHSYVYEYPGICSVFVRVITFMMITLDKSVGNAGGSEAVAGGMGQSSSEWSTNGRGATKACQSRAMFASDDEEDHYDREEDADDGLCTYVSV